MAITLLRHAAVPKYYQQRYIGWSDILIDKDNIDYNNAKTIIKTDYDLIYSSDLKRCTDTLLLLGKNNFIASKELREVRFKDEIELKNFSQVQKLPSFKQEYLSDYRSWYRYICHESYNEFKSRIDNFLGSLPKDKKILICTHNGVIEYITDKKLGYLEYVIL
jgi:broad specificity phosphatase PhoE